MRAKGLRVLEQTLLFEATICMDNLRNSASVERCSKVVVLEHALKQTHDRLNVGEVRRARKASEQIPRVRQRLNARLAIWQSSRVVAKSLAVAPIGGAAFHDNKVRKAGAAAWRSHLCWR